MIIDFNKIEEMAIDKFKSGQGELDTRNFVDSKCKIMLSRLKPGCSIGYHKHVENCEVMYIISGKGHYKYDDTTEDILPGQVHYCPMGHSHALYNEGDEDLVYFAIVPEHH